ncbi:MAG: hypothetical protein WAK60_11540 [Sedimentisphaerales bacterium]
MLKVDNTGNKRQVHIANDVAEDLSIAEDYLYIQHDPHGCMLKVGAATENLVVNYIAVKQLLVSPIGPKPQFQSCIALLEKAESCPKEIIRSMNYIRKKEIEQITRGGIGGTMHASVSSRQTRF